MIFIYINVQDINDIIAYQKTMAGAVVGGSTLRKGLLLYSPSSFYSPFWKHEQGQCTSYRRTLQKKKLDTGLPARDWVQQHPGTMGTRLKALIVRYAFFAGPAFMFRSPIYGGDST